MARGLGLIGFRVMKPKNIFWFRDQDSHTSQMAMLQNRAVPSVGLRVGV